MSEVEAYKQTEVTYKFFLPDNQNELTVFQNSTKFFLALNDIAERCRYVWKYKEDATMAEVNFAERISEIVTESGVYDVE